MKIETHSDSDKQAQLLKLLQFGTVMVFIDSRPKSVKVPPHLKNDFQLRLNFDYAYEVDDFRVLPNRIEASLSFNQENHFCVIPFDCIYLVVSHTIKHGALFTQSVPIEMLEYFAAEAQKEKHDAVQTVAGPELSVISSDSTALDTSGTDGIETNKTVVKPEDSKQQEKTEPKRGHLRLVK